MPTVYIDGKPYEYEGKVRLLEFILRQGIDLPYFCYHPGLSEAPTNCRMCLVEIGYPERDRNTGEIVKDEQGNPKIRWGHKPMTSCNTFLSDGMHVKTHHTSAVIRKAQQGVLEFMLINHPLDCPICDQAGECPLQIFTFLYGPEGSRFEQNKVHKPKRIRLGPRVVLDAERCINCTRCVRFTEEISKSHQLTIIARGDKNFPMTFPGQPFDDPYSLNTVDICPVGALTSADFRFKARVWEMSSTPGICTSCAKGCNVTYWVRDNHVLRLTPRPNPKVNQYWMCDEGRLNYEHFNKNRLSGAWAKGNAIPMDEALRYFAKQLQNHSGNILFIGSAHASVEDNYALKQLAKGLKCDTLYYVPHIQEGWGDDFLRRDDRTPNAKGCELLQIQSISLEELQAKAQQAAMVVLLNDDEVAEQLAASVGDKLYAFAHHHFKNWEIAQLLLPSAMAIEGTFTFINEDGIAQQCFQAKQIKRMTPEMWMWMQKSRLDSSGVAIDRWRHPEHIIDCLPAWTFITSLCEYLNLERFFSFKDYRSYFEHLKKTIQPMAALQLPKRPPKTAFKRTQLDFAIQ